MLHKMKLNESPFERIKNGTKNIEFRLFDEKRQQIKVGDQIEFSKLPDLQEKLLVDVTQLYREDTFERLFKKLYNDEKEIKRKTESMYKYYSQEEEKKYGVIGIKVMLYMRKLNLIVVFSKNLDKVLFCIREKEPYKGLYNFVGGKVEKGENNDEAAYRELFEETGISKNDIELDHFMDLNYFKYENNLQVYYGILQHDVILVEEKNKLKWIEINDELLNNKKFAGNYNIPHIIRQIKIYLKNGSEKW